MKSLFRIFFGTTGTRPWAVVAKTLLLAQMLTPPPEKPAGMWQEAQSGPKKPPAIPVGADGKRRAAPVLRRAGKNTGEQQVVLGDIRFDGHHLVAECRGRAVEITRREMDIVAYLHRNSNRIVSKKELLTEVWQYADAGIETRTVDIHMLKFRKKISTLVGDGPFITTVRGEGYRLDTAP